MQNDLRILTLMNLILYNFCEPNLKNYCLKYRRKEMNDFDLAKGGDKEAFSKLIENVKFKLYKTLV